MSKLLFNSVAAIGFLLFAFLLTMAIIHAPEEYRKREAAIFENGKSAGVEGAPPEVCPYTISWGGVGEPQRRKWMEGWRAGNQKRQQPTQ